MKNIIWFIFILLILGMGFQSYVIGTATREHYSIVDLELTFTKGHDIIRAWNSVSYGEGRVLDVAISNTHWDYLLIFCYVSLLLIHSNGQLQKERRIMLNMLLRLNFLLAILTGLLDIVEDGILLHNFRHAFDGLYYLPTYWVAYPKFLLGLWALGVYLVSLFTARPGFGAGAITPPPGPPPPHVVMN